MKDAVLVTGASTGFGRCTTELLASKGYFVYAGARKQEDIKEKLIMIKRTIFLTIATFFCLTVFSHETSAQAFGSRVYLGEANVDGGSDHDTIRVGGKKGYFRGLQIQVERAAIDFQHVIVVFENGGRDKLEMRSWIPAGGRTRIIDLKGNNRAIDRVEIWYSRGSWINDRKPKMRLYGRR